MTKNIKEHLIKLFEAVDPEGQLGQVKDETLDAVDAAIQAQVADKDEQVKNLEAQIEQLKAQQQGQLSPEVQSQISHQLDRLESQAMEAFDEIEQKDEQIAQLKQELDDSKQKLQTLQKSSVQQIASQIEAAKKAQQEQDAAVAIQHTQDLLDAVDKKNEQQKEEIVEAVSDFLDTFLDNKTSLNVSINSTAMLESYKETFNKIKSALMDEALFESGAKAEAEKIIKEAKATTNAQLNEAIEISKQNKALRDELDAIKGKIYLEEKVKYLKPSVAEALMEKLQGKSIEQIDKEFDKIQQQIEQNEEEHKRLLRERAKIRQQKIDFSLDSEDNKIKPVDAEKNGSKTVASAFANMIRVKKI